MPSNSFNFGQLVVVGIISGIIGALIVVGFIRRSPELLIADVGQSQSSVVQDEDQENNLSSQEKMVTGVVNSANPAVVSIVITKDVPVIERFFEDVPSTEPFGDFFGNGFNNQFQFRVPQYRERGTEKREVGGGSGFLVSADGLIITNRHVVAAEDADYTVFTNDGEKHEAEVVARDPSNDIAVIRIKGDNFPYLEFADSDNLQVGQTTVAIGNALSEFRNTVSVGVVSGLSRSIVAGDGFGQSEQLDEVIQTDAAINPGNSGGPLLDLKGKVIGVNVAIAQGSENIGFALPSNLVKFVVSSVEETGKIVRPFLGVRYIQITPELVERNNLTVDQGVLVVSGETVEDLAVTPLSAADKAGIKEGDIILEADGVQLSTETSLAGLIGKKQVGDQMQLKLLRAGEDISITVTLEEVPQ